MSRSRRARRFRHRLSRPFRRFGALTRRQQAVVAAILVAATAGVAALVLLLSPRSAAPAADSGPPLAVPSKLAPPPGRPAVPQPIRIVVPAGGIDLPVAEGDGVHVPLFLALHYPSTSEPGAGSNSLFYAHAQPRMFLGLYQVHPGDEIRVLRADGTQLRYQIVGIRRVSFNDLAVLQPTVTEQITLLTCTSYSSSDPRLIVTGAPIAG